MQRRFNKMVVTAFTTTSTLLLNLLVGVLLVNYRILELILGSQARIALSNFAPSDTKAVNELLPILPNPSNQFPTPAFFPNKPPWCHRNCGIIYHNLAFKYIYQNP